MFTYILLALGFVFLIKGADLLVDGACSIGRRLGISDLVIGLTLVAFGTSAPELFVNLNASIKGNSSIAIGNILGSNIANVFLILGISAVIYPLAVGKGTVWKELPLNLLASLLLGVMANDRLFDGANNSGLTRIDGLVFLAFFILFIYYTAGIAKKIEEIKEHTAAKQYSVLTSALMVIGGLVGLCVGGEWIVNGAVHVAEKLGVSQSLIGLTIVSIGTSLPELATSTVAAYKRNVEIAVGNVVGSNIFNIFFVLGISSVVRPLPFDPGENINITAVILSSVLLFTCMFTGKKHALDRWEGILFIILYLLYIALLIFKG